MGEQLSGGEKQRLAMARLLIAKPKIAFLDESTSTLDPMNEKRLYMALQQRKATYISIGHKVELRKYHSHILELKPEGAWDFYPSPAFQDLSGNGSEGNAPRGPELLEPKKTL